MRVIEVLVENEMFDGFTFPIKKDALCLLKIVINLYEQKWGRSIYQITNVTPILLIKLLTELSQ